MNEIDKDVFIGAITYVISLGIVEAIVKPIAMYRTRQAVKKTKELTEHYLPLIFSTIDPIMPNWLIKFDSEGMTKAMVNRIELIAKSEGEYLSSKQIKLLIAEWEKEYKPTANADRANKII